MNLDIFNPPKGLICPKQTARQIQGVFTQSGGKAAHQYRTPADANYDRQLTREGNGFGGLVPVIQSVFFG
jgi:hypothetical protein